MSFVKDINDMDVVEHTKLSELVDSINRNIYNFHKVVRKLEQNYKNNKLNIVKLTNDIEGVDSKVERNHKDIEYIEIEIKNIKNEINNFNNKKNEMDSNAIIIKQNFKLNNQKLIFFFIGNIFISSLLCLSFARVF